MKCIQRLMIYLGVNCVLNPFPNRITQMAINQLLNSHQYPSATPGADR